MGGDATTSGGPERGWRAADARIVVNDVVTRDRDGLYRGSRSVDWRQDEVGRAGHRQAPRDRRHRRLDGGAGIEHHVEHGGSPDVMVTP